MRRGVVNGVFSFVFVMQNELLFRLMFLFDSLRTNPKTLWNQWSTEELIVLSVRRSFIILRARAK